MTILTQVRKKLKFLKTLVSLPKWIGPFVTIICIAVNQQMILLGLFSPQVAWLNLPVAFSAMGGLRAGLTSAFLVTIYSIWLDPNSIQRTIIIPLSVFSLASLIGWQTRALRTALVEALAGVQARKMVDSLNGNIIRVTEAREQIEYILKYDFLPDGTRDKLKSILHTLRNLQQATKGWQELRDLRAEIDQERRDTKPLE